MKKNILTVFIIMSVCAAGCSAKDISKPQNIEETIDEHTYGENNEERTEEETVFSEMWNDDDSWYYTVASFEDDSHFYDSDEITYEDTVWNGIERVTFKINNVKAYRTKNLDSLEYFSDSAVMKEGLYNTEKNSGLTLDNASLVVVNFSVYNMSEKEAKFNTGYRLSRRVELSDIEGISDEEKEFIKSLVENDSRCSTKMTETVGYINDYYIKSTGETLSETMYYGTVLKPQTQYDFVICSLVRDDISDNNDIYLDITKQDDYEVDEKLSKKYGKEIHFPKQNINVKYLKLNIQDDMQ